MKTTQNTATILIVDDVPNNLLLLTELLADEGYTIRVSKTGKEAIAFVTANLPDLILLDISIPDMNGYEVCSILKENERTKNIPVIFISALHETAEKLKAFSCGGVDYITKPIIIEEVQARVQIHLENRRLRLQLEQQAAELQLKNELYEAEIENRKNVEEELYTSIVKLKDSKTAILNLLEDLQKEVEQGKENERKLMESEEKFSKAFLTSPYAITITRPKDGKFIEINDAFTSISGYTRNEAFADTSVGLKLWDKIDDQNYVVSHLLEGKDVKGAEFVFKKKTGEFFTGLFSAQIIYLNNEPYILSSINDITERKLIEAAVIEAKSILENLIGNLPGYIYRAANDPDFTTLFISEKIESITGYTQKEYLEYHTISCGKVIHPEDIERIWQMVQKAIELKMPYEFEYRIITKQGLEKWVWEKGSGIFNESGNLLYLEGYVTDNTEQKLAQQKLQDLKDYLDKIINSVGSPIFVKDIECKFCLVNEALCTMLGKTREQLIGKTGFEYFPDDQVEVFQAKDKEVLSTGKENINQEFLSDGQGVIRTIITCKTLYTDLNGNKFLVGIINDITGLKQIESELKASEIKYRSLFENSMMGISAAIANGQLVYTNQAYADMYGYENPEKMISEIKDIGHQLYAHPYDREKVLEILTRKGYMEPSEFEVLRRDGSHFFVLVSASEIKDTDGKVLYYQANHIDISNRKYAENKLAENEEKYRYMFANNPQPMWIYDLETLAFIEVNNAAIEHYGYTKDEFNSMTINDIRNEKDKIKLKKDVEKARDNYFPRGEFQHVKKNGDIIQVEMVSHLITFKNMHARHVMITDLTERKRVELAIQRHSERLRNLHIIDQSILQSIESPEAIIQTAIKYMATLLNSQLAGASIFDQDTHELEIFTVKALNETYSRKRVKLTENEYAIFDNFRQGKIEIVENISKEQSQTEVNRIFQLEKLGAHIIVPLFSAKNFYGILFIGWKNPRAINTEDAEITGEVAGEITIALEQSSLINKIKLYNDELEIRVQERTVQLEKANKELEAFSYSISHDLRAPLRHITGFIGLFLENKTTELTNEELGYLSTVTTAAGEMGKLIDALLSFSRLNRTEIHKTKIDTVELIRQVMQIFAVEIKQKVIEIKFGDLAETLADYQLIRQVWTNLMSNAIKYTGKRDKPIIEIGCSTEKDQTVYFIKDNGAGFDKKYAGKLFGVFQRLHKQNDYEGIGIGLANVNRIVSRHGGRCWAEGEMDNGAIFYFSLPSHPSGS